MSDEATGDSREEVAQATEAAIAAAHKAEHG